MGGPALVGEEQEGAQVQLLYFPLGDFRWALMPI